MKLSTVMQARQNVVSVTTGKKEYKNIDMLYSDLSDLVNDQFKLWYCKSFNMLGFEKILVLASQARADGNDSKKLFSYLIRKEIEK